MYALDDERVVRVLHADRDAATIGRRQALVAEPRSFGAPFELPDVLEVDEVGGRSFAIERRLPGISVMDRLASLDGHDRDLLVESHLNASAALSSLHLEPRGWFGELITEDPVRSATWRGYLAERAHESLMRSGKSFRGIHPDHLADALPEPVAPTFVHLDAFAGNMLAAGFSVTAVLDIGGTSAVVGDGRFNALSTAIYLSSPKITPIATSRDRDVAMSWLRSAGLADWLEPARRWLAAFWCKEIDDTRLHDWCTSVLLTGM